MHPAGFDARRGLSMVKKVLMVIGVIAVLAAIHAYAPDLWVAVFGLIGQVLDRLMPSQ
jgi:hypothetical protein